jgi:hypothetical protein
MRTLTLSIIALVFVFFITSFLHSCKKADDVNTPSARLATSKARVADSVPPPPVQYVTLPLTGDQITLTPGFFTNSVADTNYIYFKAQTTKTYCRSGKLNIAYSIDNQNNYAISFLNVTETTTCKGDSILTAPVNFTQNQPKALANGTYPLSILLNNVTYTGSIVVSTANITFNWKYTSGVLIEPKVINR